MGGTPPQYNTSNTEKVRLTEDAKRALPTLSFHRTSLRPCASLRLPPVEALPSRPRKMKTMKQVTYLFLALCLLTFANCNLDDDGPVSPVFTENTIVELIEDDPQLGVLEQALEITGLDISLTGANVFTIFAPTDAAFAASGIDLTSIDTVDLENILRYHLLIGVGRPIASIAEGQAYLTTGNFDSPGGGSVQLFLDRTPDAIALNGNTNIVAEEQIGTNGVVHTIDRVLMPPTVGDMISQNGLLSEYADVLAAAAPFNGMSIIDSLKSEQLFTVFPPFNSGFDPDPDFNAAQNLEVALYHIVAGRSTAFNNLPGALTTLQGDQLVFNARIVRTTSTQSLELRFENIQATNGTLHLVSEMMLPEGL